MSGAKRKLERDYYTPDEAARALELDRDTIYYLCRQGRLKAHKVINDRGRESWAIESLERQPRQRNRTQVKVIRCIEALKPTNPQEVRAVQIVLRMLGVRQGPRHWGEIDLLIKQYLAQTGQTSFTTKEITRLAPAKGHAITQYCGRNIKAGQLRRIAPATYEPIDPNWYKDTRL